MKSNERLFDDLRACLCAATRALRYTGFSALASLLDCGWRLRVIYGGRSLKRLFLQRLASAHPQEKEKARSDERA